MNPDHAWRSLRGLRATPPGLAASGEQRAAVFSAALEQSEQLMRGAASLGPASRPLNLFYGLSQAGRALAAAFIQDEDSWQLLGHGITAKNYTQDLESIEVRDSKQDRGSFTSIARLLDSPSLPEPVLLGKILSSLPTCRVQPAPWRPEPGPLRIEPTWEVINGVPPGGPWDLSKLSPDFRIHGDSPNAPTKEELSKLITDTYPQLRNCTVIAALASFGPNERWSALVRLSPVDTDADTEIQSLFQLQANLIVRLHELEDGYKYALPALPNASTPLHPLVTWWAVLWALSMVARYEPGLWMKTLSVDRNARAVPLEILLQEALTEVPSLLVRTFLEAEDRLNMSQIDCE